MVVILLHINAVRISADHDITRSRCHRDRTVVNRVIFRKCLEDLLSFETMASECFLADAMDPSLKLNVDIPMPRESLLRGDFESPVSSLPN